MKKIRIFISSPSDVIQERLSLYSVIRQLNYEFASHFIIEPLMWENLPLDVSSSFQDGIDCFTLKEGIDIAVFILGSRLGSPINKAKLDGTMYSSGTVYEFEMALRAREQSDDKKPVILAYRSKRSFVDYIPNKELFSDEKYINQCIEEQKRVNCFFDEYFKNKDENLNIRAYHEFESVTVFSQKVKEHLRVLLRSLLPDDGASVATFHGCPFKGLQAFDFEDESIFFGREKAINEIVEKLKNQAEDHKPFVLVIGQSGSGKSSLIKAGVLPRIVLSGPVENIDWRLATLSPGQYAGNLCEAFIESLMQPKAFPELVDMENIKNRIRAKFTEDAESVCWQIEDLIKSVHDRQHHKKDVRLLFFIDQFEEIFTHQNISQVQKQNFFELLNRLADSLKVWIIATIRSDYYADFQDNHLIKLRGKYGLYDLLNPNTNELKEIISEPAIRAGLHYESDEFKGISLESIILNDVKANANILPLLEFALTELYYRRTENNELTVEAYRDFGGINGALATRAEACYNEMDDNLKKAFPSVISSMLGVNKETKKPYRKHSNFDEAIKNEEHRQIIDHFTKARLFVADKDEKNQPYVSFVHEALIENWQRISDWFKGNLDYLEKEAYIKEQNYYWQNNGKDKAFLMNKIQQLNTAEILEKEWPEHLEDDDRAFIAQSRKSILRRDIQYWIVFIMLSISMYSFSDILKNWFDLPESITSNIKIVGLGILIPSIWETFLKSAALPRFKTRIIEVAFWGLLFVLILIYVFTYQIQSDNYANYFFIVPLSFVILLKSFSKWNGDSVAQIRSIKIQRLIIWSNNNVAKHFFLLTLFLLFTMAFIGGAYTKRVKSENVKALLSGNVETFVRLLDAKAEIIEMTLNKQTQDVKALLNSPHKNISGKNRAYTFFYAPENLRNDTSLTLTTEIRSDLLLKNPLNTGNKLSYSKDFFRLENTDTMFIPVSFDEVMFKTPDYDFDYKKYTEIPSLFNLLDVFKNVRNTGHNSDMILWQYVGFENGLFTVFPWNIFEDLNYNPTKRVWFNTPIDSIGWYFYEFSSTKQLGFTCAKGFRYSDGKKAVTAVDASLHKIINGFMPSFVIINNITALLIVIEKIQQPVIWTNQNRIHFDDELINQIIIAAKEKNTDVNNQTIHACKIDLKSTGSHYSGSFAYCNRLKLLCVFLYNEN